jgi:hypothetical protein
MGERVAKCIIAMGVLLAVVAAQGCKKKAVPAPQPVVRSVPRARTDFVVGALPFEGDVSATPKAARVVRQQPVQVVQVPETNDQDAAMAAEVQRHKDETLLQEQQAASTKQQQELDREVQQNLKIQQDVQAEPRIQEAPEMPLPSGVPGQEAPRIQDNPVPPTPAVPVQPTSPQS